MMEPEKWPFCAAEIRPSLPFDVRKTQEMAHDMAAKLAKQNERLEVRLRVGNFMSGYAASGSMKKVAEPDWQVAAWILGGKALLDDAIEIERYAGVINAKAEDASTSAVPRRRLVVDWIVKGQRFAYESSDGQASLYYKALVSGEYPYIISEGDDPPILLFQRTSDGGIEASSKEWEALLGRFDYCLAADCSDAPAQFLASVLAFVGDEELLSTLKRDPSSILDGAIAKLTSAKETETRAQTPFTTRPGMMQIPGPRKFYPDGISLDEGLQAYLKAAEFQQSIVDDLKAVEDEQQREDDELQEAFEKAREKAEEDARKKKRDIERMLQETMKKVKKG